MPTATDLRLALERRFPGANIMVRHDEFQECFDVRFVWQGEPVSSLIPEAKMLRPGDEDRAARDLYEDVIGRPPLPPTMN